MAGHSPNPPQAHSEGPMTIDEWAVLDDGELREFVDGHLVDRGVNSLLHDLIVAWWFATLRPWLSARGGFVTGSGVGYVLNRRRGRIPDGSAWFPGQHPPLRGAIRTPPDIALEVVSQRPRDARRDRIEKMAEYATFG